MPRTTRSSIHQMTDVLSGTTADLLALAQQLVNEHGPTATLSYNRDRGEIYVHAAREMGK